MHQVSLIHCCFVFNCAIKTGYPLSSQRDLNLCPNTPLQHLTFTPLPHEPYNTTASVF